MSEIDRIRDQYQRQQVVGLGAVLQSVLGVRDAVRQHQDVAGIEVTPRLLFARWLVERGLLNEWACAPTVPTTSLTERNG